MSQLSWKSMTCREQDSNPESPDYKSSRPDVTIQIQEYILLSLRKPKLLNNSICFQIIVRQFYFNCNILVMYFNYFI